MDFEEWHYPSASPKAAWDAGQQIKQKEIDALKNKIQTALNKACMLQNSSGERIYTELKEILK